MKAPFASLAFLGAVVCGLGAVPGVHQPEGVAGEEEALRANALLREEFFRREEKARRLRADLARAMRLDRYADDCVAQDPWSAACILSVEEFNRAVEHRVVPLREADPDFPTLEDVEACRGEVLRQILEERYFAAAPLPAQVRDSLANLAVVALRERHRTYRIRLGDSTLRAAYQALYPQAFQGGEEISFEVLASTDSTRLDSLSSSPDSSARRAWRMVPEEDLPAEALRAVGAVEPGGLAGPIRASFGYLFLREASRRKRPDVPMEDALPLLISWASRPSEGDLGWERDLENYYREHREEFSTPDTLTFRAWLLPETGNRPLFRRLEGERMRTDTANTRSMTVQDRELPPRLREELALYLPCRKGEVLGPIRSVFGTWYLQVQEIRRGGRRLTLEESRPAIRKILFGWDGEDALGPALAEAKAEELEIRTSLAARYLMAEESTGKLRADSATDGAGASSWERKRNEWMRKYLILRFVELPEPAASQENSAGFSDPTESSDPGNDGRHDGRGARFR